MSPRRWIVAFLAVLAGMLGVVIVVNGPQAASPVALAAAVSPLESARKADVAAGEAEKAGEANLAAERATKAATAEALAAQEAAKEPPAEEPPAGTVSWFGSFASGTIDKTLYPYSNFVAGHVTVMPDPLGSGQNVLKFAIPDSDRPYSGATAPRGDVESPPFFHPGNEEWIGTQTLLPIGSGFPAKYNGWFQVSEIYGKPYGGSPTMGLGLTSDAAGWHMTLDRDATHNWDRVWIGPVLDGKWHRVVFHVRFATDSTGFVEIYFDGAQQKFTNGSTRLYYTTLVSGINWDGVDGNFLDTDSYRQAGAYPGTVTLFHGPPDVASTLAAAESKLTLR